jgi:hypothetical protein
LRCMFFLMAGLAVLAIYAVWKFSGAVHGFQPPEMARAQSSIQA